MMTWEQNRYLNNRLFSSSVPCNYTVSHKLLARPLATITDLAMFSHVWKYTGVISVKLPWALCSSVLIFSPPWQWGNAHSTQRVKYQWVNKTPLLLAIGWWAYRKKKNLLGLFTPHAVFFLVFFLNIPLYKATLLFQIKDNIYERTHHLITIAMWNRHPQPQQHQQQQLTGSFCVSNSISDQFD